MQLQCRSVATVCTCWLTSDDSRDSLEQSAGQTLGALEQSLSSVLRSRLLLGARLLDEFLVHLTSTQRQTHNTHKQPSE